MHASFKHPDFINHDARRFCVRVMDAGRGTNAVSVYLATLPKPNGSHWQPSREITLPYVSPGVFVSTNVLLVSDSADASVVSSELVPDISQRLYECELDGTVRASYTDSFGIGRHEDATVGSDVKTVVLDVFVMTKNGDPAVPTSIVTRDIADAEERYAQADIRIQVGQITQVEMPSGVSTNWIVFYQQGATYRLSADAKLIFDALPKMAGHVGVVYVHAPLFGIIETDILSGIAIAPYDFKLSDDTQYLGNVFISAATPALFTPAHEVGHVLTNGGHSLDLWSLMYELGAADKEVKHPKRFTNNQSETMKGSLYIQ